MIRLSRLNNKHFLALMGNGILSLFSMGFIFLLSYSLSLGDLGKWFYFTTLMGLCEAVRNGFLNTATVKFYAGIGREDADPVVGSVWVLALSITALLLLINGIGVLCLPFIHEAKFILSIKWAGLTYVSALPYTVAFWLLQAKEDYLRILWLRLVNSGSMILIFCWLAFTHTMTLDKAILFNFLTNCLTSIVAIAWRQARLGIVIRSTRRIMVEIAHFGKYSLATTLSTTLLRSTDSFIISAILGDRALAIYSLPVRLMEIVEIPLRSFVGTGMSTMATAFNNKNMEQVAYVFKKYSGMLTIAFIPLTLLVLLFAPLPIDLLGHHKFNGTEAVNIYRLFMLCAVMYPMDRFNGVTLDIIHQPRINFQKVLIMLSVNVITDFAGIYVTGNVYGVAAGSFFTVLSGFVFGYFQLRRFIDYTITDIIKEGISGTRNFLGEYLPFLKRA